MCALDRDDWLAPGETVTLENCEREPIHLPGRVQPHGAMLIVDRRNEDRVVQASANVTDVVDQPVAAILGSSLDEVIGPGAAMRICELEVDGPPAVRPELVLRGGQALLVQCFEPAPGLLGIDLERAPGRLPNAATASRYSSRVAARLALTRDEYSCVRHAVELLRELTEFDRVWAYRFEADGHGVVVAEDRREGLEPFLGLHFPESDIPAQARQLYLTAGVRLIGDSRRDDVPLIPEINPVTGERTDLSGSDLRGVSPMHVRYLRNMGVRTSMSVPVVIEGKLWGLLSAHSYDQPRPISILTRSQCETVGTLTAMQLSAVARTAQSDNEARAQRSLRDLAANLGSASSATAGLMHDTSALLKTCGADGVIVCLGDGTKTAGTVPPPDEIDRLVEALSAVPDRDVLVTDELRSIDPELAKAVSGVAGVLAISLSKRHHHWVVWTRSEQLEHVTWANRDRELVRRDPDGELELGARESFERWAQTVEARSQPWNAAEIAAASEVRAIIGAYAHQQALQMAERAGELARVNEELDAFAYSAAHDLRQPVRAIAMRTEFVLDDARERLTADERDSMATVLRLTGHMGALVDSLLEYAKLDYAAHQPKRVRLADILDDVRDLLGSAAEGATITQDDATVRADPDTLRQVLFNLVWNAIKYSDRPPVIHIGTTLLSLLPEGRGPGVRMTDTDESDPDVIYVQDNGIGIAPEHLESIFGLFRRLHSDDTYGDGSGAGLALCRRLVQRSGGAIWATSIPGRGSTFYFTPTGPAPSPAA